MRQLRPWLLALAVGMLSLATSATTITYYHNDLLGSPVAATDASGRIATHLGGIPDDMDVEHSGGEVSITHTRNGPIGRVGNAAIRSCPISSASSLYGAS